ncbi:hypothetical protein NIES4103_38990 [Nostoc sp. NIES-4103]|nr:hypothetical protein NIES4103_38990 [Nostoc sp. NIES-4103]
MKILKLVSISNSGIRGISLLSVLSSIENPGDLIHKLFDIANG